MQIHSPRKKNNSISCFPKPALLIPHAFCTFGMRDYAVSASYYFGSVAGYRSLAQSKEA